MAGDVRRDYGLERTERNGGMHGDRGHSAINNSGMRFFLFLPFFFFLYFLRGREAEKLLTTQARWQKTTGNSWEIRSAPDVDGGCVQVMGLLLACDRSGDKGRRNGYDGRRPHVQSGGQNNDMRLVPTRAVEGKKAAGVMEGRTGGRHERMRMRRRR